MKITKKQWESIPQLDRIELAQGYLKREMVSYAFLVIFAVMLYAGFILEAFIFILFAVWIIRYNYKQLTDKIFFKYFTVKRSIREVRKNK